MSRLPTPLDELRHIRMVFAYFSSAFETIKPRETYLYSGLADSHADPTE